MMIKRNLSRIFIILLIIISSISIRVYLENGRIEFINRADNRYEASNLLANDIIETAMAVYNEKYPDYEWIIYPENDEYTNNTIRNAFASSLKEIYNERIEEKGLVFNVYVNGELISNTRRDMDLENNIIHRVLYIEDGDIKTNDNFGLNYYDSRYSDVSWLSDSFVNRIFTSRQINASYNYIYDCNINFPEGLQIDFAINDNLSLDSELYPVLIGNTSKLPYLIILALVIATLFLALVAFFVPHRVFDKLPSFKFFRCIYIGPFFFFYAFLMILGALGLVFASTMLLNGQSYYILREFGITDYSLGINILITLAYMAWFYMTIVGVDYVKDIFSYGVIKSFKERTLTANLVSVIYRSFAKIFSFDFSNHTFVRLILLIIAIYVLIVFIPNVLFYNRDIGFIFASAFYGILVVVILLQYNHYRNDYEVLLKNTHGVASVGFKDYNFIEIDSFREVQDELKNIREVIKKAVAEETKSQNLKTELITNVSHDLKTPITGMRNYLELLHDPNLDETKRNEYIEIVNNYNNRLNCLVGDLFEVSKVNAGEYSLNKMELDVVSLVHQALVECEDAFEEKHLTTIVNNSEDKVMLNLDGDKTYRIFENLLINISKYALANTRVYVDILENSKYVEIIFKNISEVQIDLPADKLTERFVRGDKSRSQSGSGLGLAIVTSFTEIQNGEFKITTDGDLFKAVVRFYK